MTTTTAPPQARPARTALLLGGALLALGGAVLLSLAVGSKPTTPGQVWAALTHTADPYIAAVVASRYPRTVLGVLAGAALALSGLLMQGITRNPLADPGLLGVNAGAAFAVALGITFLGVTTPAGYMWLACLGALVVAVGVHVLGGAADLRASPARLVVTGVAVGAVLAGLTSGLTLTHPDTFDRMRGWAAGSLLERGPQVVLPVLPLVVLGLLVAALTARSLNAVALGPDVAQAQGVDVRRTRVLVLAAVTVLAGGATAIAGPVAFVGLMVPHVVRWTLGTDQRRVLAGSLLGGCVLVVASDVVGRVAVPPGEMPVGVVTAFVGAPVMIALARRRRATAL